jgi:hypothetical protein
MSAWQLGWNANVRRGPKRSLRDETPQGALATIIGKVLKWTSADVVVLFGAAVSLYVINEKQAPAWLLIVGAGLSPVFVLLGAYAARETGKKWWTSFVT